LTPKLEKIIERQETRLDSDRGTKKIKSGKNKKTSSRKKQTNRFDFIEGYDGIEKNK
jgi:hypothetical protein